MTLLDFFLNRTPILYLTQSLWRDEAFSVAMSQGSIWEIIRRTASDFNPPLYYLFLHFWMKVFGSSEISLRMPSFIFFSILIYVVYKFAKKLNLNSFFPVLASILTATNPLLLNLAFEARMYLLLCLFATLSIYYFYQKKWRPYIVFSILGLYTQPYMIFVIMSQFTYLLLTQKLTKKNLRPIFYIFLLYLPWLPVLVFQFARSGPMWIWPINATTVQTILGNIYTGYEGTPGNFWWLTKILSAIILILSAAAVRGKKGKTMAIFFLWLFLPALLVLAVSYFKPIYVNRYLIFAAVAEVFLITGGIYSFKNRFLRVLLIFSFFIFNFSFNFWFAPYHKKIDIRQAMAEIKLLAGPADLIIAKSPLVFFETEYYSPNPSRVFLYNPQNISVPHYAGDVAIPKGKMIQTFPDYPKRAFLVFEDGHYELVYNFVR